MSVDLRTLDRAGVERELARIRAQLDKARGIAGEKAIEYAATPDGAAETYRRYELTSGAEQERLRAVSLAGLAMSDEEYQRRVQLGNASAHDGPLQVIAAGPLDSDPVRVLIAHRVMGTLRSGPDLAASQCARIQLMRLAPDGRTRYRLAVTYPAPFGIFTATLAEVVTAVATQGAVRGRLVEFLGAPACAGLGL